MSFFDPWYIVVAGFFSLIGFAAFLYGKRQEDFKCIILGLLLCGVSYFISDPLILSLVSIVIVAFLFSESIARWLQSFQGDDSPPA